ncbi:hypothetical protein OIU76_028595 [Salix suchowensis]|nr:hypothetical protein OIU76_028595 [Salix suchowensis]
MVKVAGLFDPCKMSKVSESALFVMIFRQQFSKTLPGIRAKPCLKRSFNTRNTGESSNAHNLIDKTSHRNLSFQIIKDHFRSGFIDNIDEFTVANALKACRGYPLLGSQIHGFSIIHEFVNFTIVSNSLMNMYCKSGQFCKALCIFEDLTHPDIVSWNTMLSGCQASEDAFFFACKMNSSGVVFDAVTYTTVLSFCWRLVEAYFLFGLQLHSCIVKFGFDCEVFVGNALISMYSRWGHLVEARRVFEEMKTRDLVSWNAMISGYSQEGIYGLEAISMFLQMFRGGMELDRISFTSAVSACGYERNLELARQIHGLSIKTRHEKHVAVANVLISTYFKCQVIEDARLVFQNMNERNVVSWTTMISIDEAEAVSFFNEMRLDGVYPNDVTFVGLIHAITIGELLCARKDGSCILYKDRLLIKIKCL